MLNNQKQIEMACMDLKNYEGKGIRRWQKIIIHLIDL
jgi:hypothetical protein